MLGELPVRSDTVLAPHISQEVTFRSIQNLDCAGLFKNLRKIDSQSRAQILTGAYKDRHYIFPNAQEFAQAASDLLGVHWFEPQGTVNFEKIEQAASLTQDRLGIARRPIRIIKGPLTKTSKFLESFSDDQEWRGAWARVRDMARDMVARSERNHPWHVARHVGEESVVSNAPGNIIYKSKTRAGSYLQWIVLQDLLPKSNPFQGLISMYEEGAYPVGQDEKNFIVLHP